MEKIVEVLKLVIDHAAEVARKNLEFLLRRCWSVIDVSYTLIDDVVIIVRSIALNKDLPEDKREEVYTKYMMYPMLLHVAYPNVIFLPTLLLLGALPHAFYTLRTVLEAFAIALYADTKEELRDLPWWEKAEHKSVRNATLFGIKDFLEKALVNVFGDRDGREWLGYILDLYQAISAWVHPVARIRLEGEELAAGLLRAIIIATARRGTPPSYGAVMPMEYTEKDIEDLKHLADIASHARLALAAIAYAWSVDKDFVDREALHQHLEKVVKEVDQQS